MGVYAHADVDFAGIGAAMGETISHWFNANISIIDPNLGDAQWDVVTNETIEATPTVIWTGPARIQPISSVANPVIGYSQEAVRQVRVNIPLDASAGLLRKGLRIVVNTPGNDYALDATEMTISGAVNSSYAWARTLICELDLKVGDWVG